MYRTNYLAISYSLFFFQACERKNFKKVSSLQFSKDFFSETKLEKEKKRTLKKMADVVLAEFLSCRIKPKLSFDCCTDDSAFKLQAYSEKKKLSKLNHLHVLSQASHCPVKVRQTLYSQACKLER